MATSAVAVIEARSARSADEAHRRAVLTWLRCLHVRIAMFGIEVDTIGVALRDDRVTPDDALAWLHELDPRLLDLVGAEVEQ
jgi:hypothetical protein